MTQTNSFLPMLRELGRCYQAFEQYSSAHVRAMGLTPSQFDIIAALGDTPGMTFKELGEKTLITKGTLTGVVDRLEGKGLVKRVALPQDGRCSVVKLTRAGEREFKRVFLPHADHMGKAFGKVRSADIDALRVKLCELRSVLESSTGAAAQAEEA
jgi:MarR family transcriptional regulator, 2-MHQ and catechol-resistance regulon repressor